VKCIYRPQSVRNEICLKDFNTPAGTWSLHQYLCLCVCEQGAGCAGVWVKGWMGLWVYGWTWTQKVNEFVWRIEKLIQLPSLALIRKSTGSWKNFYTPLSFYVCLYLRFVCVCTPTHTHTLTSFLLTNDFSFRLRNFSVTCAFCLTLLAQTHRRTQITHWRCCGFSTIFPPPRKT